MDELLFYYAVLMKPVSSDRKFSFQEIFVRFLLRFLSTLRLSNLPSVSSDNKKVLNLFVS